MNQHNPKQQKWKSVAPCITDFTYENHTEWPITACRWGPSVSENNNFIRQKMYFSFRTDGNFDESSNSWKSVPSQLVIANVDIPQPGYQIHQQVQHIYLQQQFFKNPHMRVKSVIIHPGDANVIRNCVQSTRLVATKNDYGGIYIWDVLKHKGVPTSGFREGCHASLPELTLIGHNSSQETSFALDWSSEYKIASGSKDTKILIWDIGDYQTRLSSSSIFTSKRELNNICGNENVKLDKRIILSGHSGTVEDVSFHPVSSEQLVSCSVDKKLIGWDIRTEGGKVWELQGVHKDDINCVEWNHYDSNLIASGASDGTIYITDIRNPIVLEDRYIRVGSQTSILSLRFGPERGYLSIGCDELFVVNIDQIDYSKHRADPIFCYYGHKGSINDFDINPKSPWTFLSTCQENMVEDIMNLGGGGGGQLHVFRALDLIYMNEEEALEKLNFLVS